MSSKPKAKPDADQPNESQLAVHWKEEEYYYPPASFICLQPTQT